MIYKTKKTAVILTIMIFIILIGISHAQIQKNSELLNTENELHFQTETPLRSHFVGFPIEKKIAVSGGLPPYAFTILDSHLPKGITLSDEGILSGTAQTISRATFTIRVNEQSGQTVQETFIIDFVEQLMIQTNDVDNAIAGKAYSYQMLATGGSQGEYNWKIVSNNIPEGMQLDPQSGIFSGIPQNSGKYIITVVVQDPDGHTSTKPFSFRIIEPLKFKSLVMPSGLLGEEYSELIQISGGVGPYSFRCSDNLPEGLSLDPVTGIIEGVAAEACGMHPTITVQDNFLEMPQYVEEKIKIYINENFSFRTNSVLPDALQNAGLSDIYYRLISVNGGKWPYSFEIIEGNLPFGGESNYNGSYYFEWYGNLLIHGDFSFTLQATDSKGNIARKTFYWHIIEEMNIITKSLPDAMINEPYYCRLLAKGGTPPLTWSYNGSLPKGLELVNDKGVFSISGIPIESKESAAIYLKIVDSHPTLPQTETATYDLNVLNLNIASSPFDYSITNQDFFESTAGVFFSEKIVLYPYTSLTKINLSKGNLPKGLEFDYGSIKGRPERKGVFPFSVEVYNLYNEPVFKSLTIVVRDPLSILNENLAAASRGKFYSQTIETKNVNISIQTFGLPSGLKLKDNSILGVPSESAVSSKFNIYYGFDRKCFVIVVLEDPSLIITTGHIAEQIQYQFFTQKLEAHAGVKPYQWKVLNDYLPQGLDFFEEDNHLYFEGTPSQCGEFELDIKVIDSSILNQQFDSQSFRLKIHCNATESDTTPPSPPVNLISTPDIKELSNGFINIAFQPGQDQESGIAGYSYQWSYWSGTTVNNTIDTAKTHVDSPLLHDGDDHYFNIASIDNCGNVSETIHFGPFKVRQDNGGIKKSKSKNSESTKQNNDYEVYHKRNIFGKVTQCGTEIPLSNVRISTNDGVTSVFTNALGEFAIPDQISGTYTLIFSKKNFYNQTERMYLEESYDLYKNICMYSAKKLKIVTDQTLPFSYQGDNYWFTIHAEGGHQPYTFFLEGELPQGVLLNPNNGLISGFIERNNENSGNFTFNISATDQKGQTSKETFYMTIFEKIKILPFSVEQNHIVGHPLEESLSVTGGKPPYSFEVYSQNMPDGITLSETGILQGTPETIGETFFMVRVTDYNGRTVDKGFNMNIFEPITIETVFMDNAIVGEIYNFKFAAKGGANEQYQWGIVSDLPDNMAIHKDSGVFSGVPLVSEKIPITFQVQDTLGFSAKKSLIFHAVKRLEIQSLQLKPGSIGTMYNDSVIISGGVPPYTFACPGWLPENISIDPVSGTLKGLPTEPTQIEIEVFVKDSFFPSPQRDEELIQVIIKDNFSFVSKNVLPDALENISLESIGNVYIHTEGEIAPITCNITNGNLPIGITIETGEMIKLTGMPKMSGNFIFTLEATDHTGVTINKEFFWNIIEEMTITTLTLPDAIINEPYHETLIAKGGVSPYIWKITKGKFPDGLSLSEINGVWIIDGIPTENSQTEIMKLRVRDSNSINPWIQYIDLSLAVSNNNVRRSLPQKHNKIHTTTYDDANAQYSSQVVNKMRMITQSTLKSITIGYPYHQNLIVSGGQSPYLFELSGGSLPDGITITNTGLLTGKPEKVCKNTFDVYITDDTGQTIENNFFIEVVEKIVIENEVLPDALVGHFYKTMLSATGGVEGQLLWEVNSRNIPKDMVLDKFTGEFYGLPKTPKKNMISIMVKDSNGNYTQKVFPFRVVPPIQIQKRLYPGYLGEEYSETIQITGGVPPYTFQSSDDFPKNLYIDSLTGTIKGTAIVPGRMDIKIFVKDSFYPQPLSHEDIITLIINEDFQFTTNSVLPRAYQNQPLAEVDDFLIKVNGGEGPYSFSIIDGHLPKGVLLESEQYAKLTQIPEESGSFSFVLQASDATNKTIQKQFFWQIVEQIGLTTQLLPDAILNQPYYQILKINGGLLPYECSIIKGTLPDGLELIKINNIWTIRGIPTKLSENFEVTIAVRDSQEDPDNNEFVLFINVIENKLTIFPEHLPNGKIGKSYQVKIDALFGSPPYTWDTQTLPLPDGLNWNIRDHFIWIQGKPQVSGHFKFCLKVCDSDFYSEPVFKDYTIIVQDEISILTDHLNKATFGEFYSQTIEIENFDDMVTCQLIEGQLPEGLDISSETCTISGWPSIHATSQNITIKAIKSGELGSFDKKCLFILINKKYNPLVIITKFLISGKQYRSYFWRVEASGGSHPYKWFFENSQLPEGMEYYNEDNIMEIGGCPISCGNIPLTVKVIDSSTPPQYDTKLFQMKSYCSEIIDITPPSPPQIRESIPDLGHESTGDITIYLDSVQDQESGFYGFSYVWDTEELTIVDNTIETHSRIIKSTLIPSNDDYYFHVASVDKAKNISETIHYGPFKVVQPIQPGDIDGDNQITLQDVIAALKVISSKPVNELHMAARVNNNEPVSLIEALFVMDKIKKQQ